MKKFITGRYITNTVGFDAEDMFLMGGLFRSMLIRIENEIIIPANVRDIKLMLDCIKYYEDMDIVRFALYCDVEKALNYTDFELHKNPNDSKTAVIGVVSETNRCEDTFKDFDDFCIFVKEKFSL
jgi:hypothetical protein